MTIPRTTISLSYGEIFRFLVSLFEPATREQANNYVSMFETEFANLYSYPRGVVFCKARMAMYHLLRGLNLKPGGEVIISGIHVADFVNIIRLAGFKPVVADIQEQSYNIDFEDLERKITDRTVFMLITHLSGYATDMDKVMEISHKYHLPFAEDCSQAIDCSFKGQRLGTFGHAAIFSLSLIKPVCTMNGGMLISKDEALLGRLRAFAWKLKSPARLPLLTESLKNLALKMALWRPIFGAMVFPLVKLATTKDDHLSKFQKANKTVELRHRVPEEFLTSFRWQQARLGLSQLKSLKARQEKRIKNGEMLYATMSIRGNDMLPLTAKDAKNSYFLFPILTEDPSDFKRHLAKAGIDSSPMLLSAVSQEPAFAELSVSTERAQRIRARTLFLPMYHSLTADDVDHIANQVAAYGRRVEANRP